MMYICINFKFDFIGCDKFINWAVYPGGLLTVTIADRIAADLVIDNLLSGRVSSESDQSRREIVSVLVAS